jgi:AcrR family transcriptional regulator
MASSRARSAKEPRQQRSKDTLERLLRAAKAVLSEVSVEEATVAQIVRRSGMSVGAFYGRFADKEAMLQCLDESFFQRARQHWDDFFASAQWQEGPLHERLHRLVSLIVKKNRAHRPLLRALLLYTHFRPDPAFATRREKLQDYVLDHVCKTLLARPGSIRHPKPELVARLGLRMLFSAVQEFILFGTAPLGDDDLTAELTRALLAYLRIRSPLLS